MSVATKVSRFDRVRSILDKAAGSNAQAFGGLELWSMSRDQMVAARLMGLPLIELKKAAHSCCCKPGAAATDRCDSALLSGLRGAAPFDGSQFPQLPWGRPPMDQSEIAEITDWITDGAPATDAEQIVYQFAANAWKAETTIVEIAPESASDVAEAFAEYDGVANEYKYQHGELRQRMNIDCMTPLQIEKLRFAFREMYALNSWPEDTRSYNNLALIHQNHCQHGWERFLPWHRVYLYEFEQVMQYFCPEVTMPYWDWTMPQYRPAKPNEGQILPACLKLFLTDTSIAYLNQKGIPGGALQPLVGKKYATWARFAKAAGKLIDPKYLKGTYRDRFIDALLDANSLWYPLRYSGEFGKGTINTVIHYHYPTADDMAQIMSLRTFRDFGGGSLYDDAFGFLDQNPHNTMHIWTGGMNPEYVAPTATPGSIGANRNSSVQVIGRQFHKRSDLYTQPQFGDMFSNLTASYDPVFWPIHANIDRLWNEWQQFWPNSQPTDLDGVLTPWSYTTRDTLDMRRFGYEYVKSTCLIPVGAGSPVARFVSQPLEIADSARASFQQAEVRLHRVPQLPRSCFVRVFLNLPSADATTPIDHPNYAGYLAIFGHGDCIGGPGHCAVPARGKFDLRPRSHNTPRNHRVNVSKCARKLFEAGATTLQITLVVIGADYQEDRELLRLDGVSLVFLD